MRVLFVIAVLSLVWLLVPTPGQAVPELPYAEHGLTEEEAAAHLLGRLTFGPRPGEVQRAVDMGLEAWLEEQLSGDLREPRLSAALARLPGMSLSSTEIAARYPPPGLILRQAEREGLVNPEDRNDFRRDRKRLEQFMDQRGWRPQKELMATLMSQKLLQAVHSPNQLREVLTDFWFNHFNVSLTDNQARPHLLSYERDAIRPRVFGSFRELLGATAKHPAMLLYLDNAQSSAAPEAMTSTEMQLEALGSRIPTAMRRRAEGAMSRRKKGINENYARELMELHTLGVDGGYGQEDVQEVARALTGWTVFPVGPGRERLQQVIGNNPQVFKRQGDFLFAGPLHDTEAKSILGRAFPAGGGLEEGEQILDMLAAHPSTARHVAHKFAVRFVSDTPPQSLVDHLADTFTQSRGDTRSMIRALVQSPEFWSPEARAAKIKSPFELMVSAIRILDARVTPTRQLYQWMTRMGQPLYAYQAPTGFPDEAQWWINSGTLVARMNFALSLATGQVPGITYDTSILEVSGQDTRALLADYAARLLPGRPVDLDQLLPSARDPELASRLSQADASQAEPVDQDLDGLVPRGRPMAVGSDRLPAARVVGVLLGSPEFQRR